LCDREERRRLTGRRTSGWSEKGGRWGNALDVVTKERAKRQGGLEGDCSGEVNGIKTGTIFSARSDGLQLLTAEGFEAGVDLTDSRLEIKTRG
jgi:hypothetical protein